jgi:hypothetical protein
VDKIKQDSRIGIKISFGDHHLLKMLLLAQYYWHVVNGKVVVCVWVSASGRYERLDIER